MRIKKIRFIDEIRDEYNDSIDVGVVFEEGYSYTIVVRIPDDFVEEILQEKTNFIEPGSPMIVVKKLTKEIVTEAIEAYAKDEGYWLKLCQFGDHIDISVLNKLDATFREECSLYYLEGFNYYLQKYAKISPENRVLLELMLFFTFLSSIAYCLLKPGLIDFFYNFLS